MQPLPRRIMLSTGVFILTLRYMNGLKQAPLCINTSLCAQPEQQVNFTQWSRYWSCTCIILFTNSSLSLPIYLVLFSIFFMYALNAPCSSLPYWSYSMSNRKSDTKSLHISTISFLIFFSVANICSILFSISIGDTYVPPALVFTSLYSTKSKICQTI